MKLIERMIGPGWREMEVGKVVDALEDSLAADSAEWDQFKAEYDEEKRFGEAIVAAMRERGATFGSDVYDDVARDLYGGHTPLTRRVIAEAEAFASGSLPTS